MMTIAAETKLWFVAPFARVRIINHLIFITNYEEFLNYVSVQDHKNPYELLKSQLDLGQEHLARGHLLQPL